MANPVIRHFVIHQGATFSATLTAYADNGSQFDITGMTLRSEVRDMAGVGSRYFTPTVTHVSGSSFTWALSAADTADSLAAAQGRTMAYDIEADDGSTFHKLYRGTVRFVPESTFDP